MAAILELPKRDKKDEDSKLISAMDDMLAPAIAERNIHQVGWWVTDGYMQGVREFTFVDYETGDVEIAYESSDGEMHMRWEEALTLVQNEVGRLSRLDTSPSSKKKTHSIESLRNASVSQVILEHMNSGTDSDMMNIQFLTGLVLYGTYGIASWRDYDSRSTMGDIKELVPPWELLGIPAGTSNPSDTRAVIRTRLFPLVQLARMPGIDLPKNDDNLNVMCLQYGADVSGVNSRTGFGIGGSNASIYDRVQRRSSSRGKTTKDMAREIGDEEKYVLLRECWTIGMKNSVHRYIARAGDAIVQDVSFANRDVPVPFPIGIARYEDTGHFYGRSFAGKIIPFYMELERMLESLLQNISDADRFGYLLVPGSMGLTVEDFKATEKPRVLVYEDDPGIPQQKADALQPVSASDVPGRIMQLGLNLVDRLASQGPLFSGDAPGRADSGQAFSVLAQMGSTHLVPVAISIERAYSQMFRSQLYAVHERFAEEGGTGSGIGLELTKVENTIAGVTIDPETGKVVLDANSIPDPWSVDLAIVSRDPTSGDRERTEALQMLQLGLLEPLDFIILNYKNGWGYPVGARSVWENYVKAVLMNLIIFNDGETPQAPPGNDIFNVVADKPEVHLLAIEDFISGPEFSLASDVVQAAFYQRVSQVKAQLGEGIPPQMATMDQTATQQAMMRSRGNGMQQVMG